MLTKTRVWISTSFTALHNWTGAHGDVAYLAVYHRHVFHVVMKWKVEHNDRDIEFIQMKTKVNKYIQERFQDKKLYNTSCEMMAEELLYGFNACYVSVSEDNENGAEVERK